MSNRSAKPFELGVSGPTWAAFDWENMHGRILEQHPGATPHGGVNSWHWTVGDQVVAEAVASELGWKFQVAAPHKKGVRE